MRELPRLYREDPDHRMAPLFLSDEEYARAIESFVIVCTDAIVVNEARQTVYLARRRVKPIQGWWIIGGRMRAGEEELTSVRRCFQRETSLDLLPNRFRFIRIHRYFLKDRQQTPQDKGSDNLAFVFAVELIDDELTQASGALDPNEYEPGGLREFDRAALVAEGVHQAIVDLYDALFPKLE